VAVSVNNGNELSGAISDWGKNLFQLRDYKLFMQDLTGTAS
jgi:hypothetical protein